MATTIVEKLLVQIEGSAAQLQAELAKGGSSVKQFGRDTQGIATSADGLGARYSRAALTIAGAAESMARSGGIAGGGLKTIVAQGAQMAFLFGPTGAVVGALGIAGLAIVETFRRARDDVQKLADETKRALDELQNQGDAVGLVARAKVLFEGTPAEGFRNGLKALGDELTQLDAKLKGSQLVSFSASGALLDPLGAVPAKVKERREQIVAELQKLQNEFRDIQRRLQEPGPRIPRPVETITTTAPGAASPEKLRAQAAEQLRIVRELQQGFDDLFARARGGTVSVDEFDRAIRDLGDSFRDRLQRPTAQQTALFDGLLTQSRALRADLQTLSAAKATREFEQMLAALTPTVVDDFRLKLRGLNEELAKKDFTADQIEQIRALEQALADSAIGLEETERRIAEITASSISAMDAQLRLEALIQQLEQDIREQATSDEGLAGGAAAEVRIAGLRRQVELLAAKIKELGGGAGGADVLPASAAAKFAAALSDAADFALGVSTALLGADDSITRMVAGTGQIVSGFAKISALAENAGGFAKLFSSSAGFASALPGLGAIVGGIGALASIGGDSPESKALRETMEKNTARLVELRDGIVDLTVSLTGGKLAAIRDVPIPGFSGSFQNTGAFRNVQQILADFRKAGVGLDDLRKAAADFGISLSETPTLQQLADLQEAIKTFSLKKLLETLGGQLTLLEAQARVDPEAFAGIEGVLKRIGVLTGKQGIPAIGKALAGLDLRTAEGQAAAIEKLKALLANIGGISLDDIGGIDPQQLPDIIAQLVESIRAAAPAIETAAQRFQKAIDLIAAQVEFGLVTPQQALEKRIAAFASAFGDLAEGIDFTSAESFRASIKSIIDSFDDDGQLDEKEQALLEAFRALGIAFDAAAPKADVLIDALDVLTERFALFGTTALDQLDDLIATFAAKGGGFSALEGLADGLDVTGADGLAELRARVQALFTAIAADGISESEQPLVDALRRILGVAEEAFDEAARAAADEAAAAADALAQRRRRVFGRAEQDIDLGDVTDPTEQLKIRARAFAEAFPLIGAALAAVDPADVDAFEGAIAATIAQLRALQDAGTTEFEGVAIDELIEALVDLESGADTAAEAVDTLAGALEAAFTDLDFAFELENITDPLERLARTAQRLRGVDDRIADALSGIDLATEAGRKAAEQALVALGAAATDEGLRAAVLKLLGAIRAVESGGSPPPDAGPGDRGARETGRTTAAGAATITEVTGNRLVDLFQRNVFATEAIEALMRSAVARVALPPAIAPPALPSLLTLGRSETTSGTPAVVFHIDARTIFQQPVSVGDPQALADEISRRQIEIFQERLSTDLIVALRARGIGTRVVS